MERRKEERWEGELKEGGRDGRRKLLSITESMS